MVNSQFLIILIQILGLFLYTSLRSCLFSKGNRYLLFRRSTYKLPDSAEKGDLFFFFSLKLSKYMRFSVKG